MATNNSTRPELVFSPNLSGYDGDDRKRLNNFLRRCKHGSVADWSCKKTAKAGDIYLYWFGAPANVLAGIGVSDGKVVKESNDGWNWTDSKFGRFCGFEPLVALRTPIALEDITSDRILGKWWRGRPFQGRPKRIVRPDVAQRLAALIRSRNPKQPAVTKLLKHWGSTGSVRKPQAARPNATSKPSSRPRTVADGRPPTAWRMAMRFGDRGYEMWPQCRTKGVTAITYHPFACVDLRKHGRTEPASLWKKLSAPQRGSLRRVAFDMRKGDVVYVKQGTAIVGRGTVVGSYQFDSRCTIIDPAYPNVPFAHQVPVRWDLNFPQVEIKLGAEQTTVLELTGARLRRLEQAVVRQVKQEAVFIEGAVREIQRELAFRDVRLRRAAIRTKGCICEVCRFDFEATYGGLGEGFIEVHHKRALSQCKGKRRKTTVGDVSVVCSNCHRMLHRRGAIPLSISELRKIVALRQDDRA